LRSEFQTKSHLILPPLDIASRINIREEVDVKEFSDKAVGSNSPLYQAFFKRSHLQPTRIILAIAMPHKHTKSTFVKVQTKFPSENKAYQMIQKLSKIRKSPDPNFKALLNGSKLAIS
jgi:hypothetical protein